MLVSGRDVVQRVADFEEMVKPLHLRPWQWDLLLILDGRTPLVDIAARLELELPLVLENVGMFCDQGLLTVPTLKLEEYRRRLEIARARSRGPVQPSQEGAPVKEGRQIEYLPEAGAESPSESVEEQEPEALLKPSSESFLLDETEEAFETNPEPNVGSPTLQSGIAFSLKAPNPPPPPSSSPGSIGFKLK